MNRYLTVRWETHPTQKTFVGCVSQRTDKTTQKQPINS